MGDLQSDYEYNNGNYNSSHRTAAPAKPPEPPLTEERVRQIAREEIQAALSRYNMRDLVHYGL